MTSLLARAPGALLVLLTSEAVAIAGQAMASDGYSLANGRITIGHTIT